MKLDSTAATATLCGLSAEETCIWGERYINVVIRLIYASSSSIYASAPWTSTNLGSCDSWTLFVRLTERCRRQEGLEEEETTKTKERRRELLTAERRM